MARPFIDCAISARGKVDIEDIEEDCGSCRRGNYSWVMGSLGRKASAFNTTVPYCVAVGMIFGDAGLLQLQNKLSLMIEC